MPSVGAFFAGHATARALYDAVAEEIEALGGDVRVRVGRSQVAFARGRTFAAVWMPGRYLRGEVAPLVLTVFLPQRDDSPRWKEVVEPAPGRFTHHLELRDAGEVDEEVRAWLRRAWEAGA